MNDEPITTPEQATATPSTERRFPVGTQLTLLAGFLLFLFAAAGGSVSQFVTSLRSDEPESTTDAASTVVALSELDAMPYAIVSDVPLIADAALVWDVVGEQVLFEKNADQVLPLASVTKLMTALVAYELVAENTTVTIPGKAAAQESASGLRPGERFTQAQLVDLALINSANDAAYALANAVGSVLGPTDATAQFVAAMNVRAEELGLQTLQFRNTTGLDLSANEPGAVGSARDVSQLMAFLVSTYPDLLKSTTKDVIRVYNAEGDFHDANNTNPLVHEIPNLLGSKTGYTDLAGGNLTIAFDAGYNRPVIVTVLSSSRQGRFADVAALIEAVRTGSID